MFAYCGNNPVAHVDIVGYYWETAFDIASLCVSIADVIKNPNDPMTWLSVAADIASIAIPVASGGGTIVKAVTKADDVVDASKTISKVSNAADTATAGWRVGDDITNLTKAGNAPSWSTVRQRYWKNEALLNAGAYSDSNLALMRKGRAPLVELNGNFYSMELHHIIARRDGGSNAYSNLIRVAPWEHSAIDPFRHFNFK